ncbi:response regulator transcription factor [Pseudomonas sp. NA-150]|uniref:response regulator transcription factor n=1 Tax=Pseudomonas sp. NA-150 TaxID=3367525 RepID=UPI0037CA394A
MITVCVVDDDFSVRKSLSNLLKSAGYRAVSFASGEEFLSSTAVDESACVLLDLKMIGMQGLEVQHRLHEAGKSLGVICMSAHDDDDSVQRALAAGAVRFLRKPFSEDVLLASIMAVLDRR